MIEVTSRLDLLPLMKRVFFGPSINLGYFFLSRRMARIDLGFSSIAYNIFQQRANDKKYNQLKTEFERPSFFSANSLNSVLYLETFRFFLL
jgi:hypothetical protein